MYAMVPASDFSVEFCAIVQAKLRLEYICWSHYQFLYFSLSTVFSYGCHVEIYPIQTL